MYIYHKGICDIRVIKVTVTRARLFEMKPFLILLLKWTDTVGTHYPLTVNVHGPVTNADLLCILTQIHCESGQTLRHQRQQFAVLHQPQKPVSTSLCGFCVVRKYTSRFYEELKRLLFLFQQNSDQDKTNIHINRCIFQQYKTTICVRTRHAPGLRIHQWFPTHLCATGDHLAQPKKKKIHYLLR